MKFSFRKAKQPSGDEATQADAITAPPPVDEKKPNSNLLDPDDDLVDGADGADLAPASTTATQDIEYPSGVRLALILSSIFVSMFLVALDRMIIATAIPKITDEFNSVTDIGWYGSAYLLTTCAFQLMFGKLYTFYSIKLLFLVNVFLFEAGSAICGAAPSSVAFIIGRAVSGIGAGGIMSGTIVILVYNVPLHKRPLYQGMFGAVFGLSSVVGPLLGGAFTSNVTWRWCFYINLPFGGIAAVFIIFLLKTPTRKTALAPTREKLAQLDGIGTFFFIPGCVCLLLALQWGGSAYAWSNGRIIALLTLGPVLLVCFVVVQILRSETATVPPRIFLQRSIMAGFYSTLCVGGQMMIFVYYLPIYFQAIQGVSAVESGIRTLPLVLSMVVSVVSGGILITRVGYYTPFMLAGVTFMSVGAGLLTTLQVDTPSGKWIGYQILLGFGMGLTFQAPNLAAQTVLPRRDVSIGTSLMFFGQLLGGAIFTSVGQNVLDQQLLKRLQDVPGLDPRIILQTGATTLTQLPGDIKSIVLFAYNEALRKVLQVGLILVCLTLFGALALEWRSVKKNLPPKGAKAGQDVTKAEEGLGGDAAAGTEATADSESIDDVTKPDTEKPKVAPAEDAPPATPATQSTALGTEKE